MADPDAQTTPEDIVAMSFEEALAELEAIVTKLERGDVKLDESIEIYARGTHLKSHCERKLQAARSRIDKLVLHKDGTVGAETLSLDGDG